MALLTHSIEQPMSTEVREAKRNLEMVNQFKIHVLRCQRLVRAGVVIDAQFWDSQQEAIAFLHTHWSAQVQAFKHLLQNMPVETFCAMIDAETLPWLENIIAGLKDVADKAMREFAPVPSFDRGLMPAAQPAVRTGSLQLMQPAMLAGPSAADFSAMREAQGWSAKFRDEADAEKARANHFRDEADAEKARANQLSEQYKELQAKAEQDRAQFRAAIEAAGQQHAQTVAGLQVQAQETTAAVVQQVRQESAAAVRKAEANAQQVRDESAAVVQQVRDESAAALARMEDMLQQLTVQIQKRPAEQAPQPPAPEQAPQPMVAEQAPQPPPLRRSRRLSRSSPESTPGSSQDRRRRSSSPDTRAHQSKQGQSRRRRRSRSRSRPRTPPPSQ